MRQENARDPESPELEHSHVREDIRRRLSLPAEKSYLRDAVYGAIDGAVTTFAIVSGVSGAGLASEIVIILGMANLVGDGFSMAAGNFLGTRAENQRYDLLYRIERKHIEQCPDGEREEVRQIYRLQGYEGKLLEATVDHVTSNEETWIRTMLQYEYGVSGDRPAPVPAAVTTFLSFVLVGLIPLLPFLTDWMTSWTVSTFSLSTALTAFAFGGVGAIKSRYVDQHWAWSAIETLTVGATAAALAYFCGFLLGNLEYH